MSSRLLYDSHSHTKLCNHAVGEPDEYAQAAFDRGLKGMMVTCHNPMPNGFSAAVRMREDEFDLYVDMVAETTDRWSGRVDVRLGLEADFFEGHEAYLEKQLASQEFHFVLGSVHPQIPEFRKTYWTTDPVENQKTYFRLLAKSAKTGLFDSLAHPDLIKNFTAEGWDSKARLDVICPALDEIADTGVAMELNTSGVNKTISEMNPFPEMLRQMNVRGIPVTLGSDAHEPGRVGDGFITALELLEHSGYDHVTVFEKRKPQRIAIADALMSLSQHS